MAAMGVNRDYLKRANRGLALKLVATGQCASRIELSREMGLTKTAISVIVGELIQRGFLVETCRQMTPEPGPKPVRLEIGPGAPKFAGVLIQRGYAEAAVCDLNMRVLKFERIDREWADAAAMMATVFELLDHMLSDRADVAAIGASSIGQVDVLRGYITRPLYFNGIHDVDLVSPIRERYGLPVFFDHDDQSAALVEQLYGNGRGYQDILMVGIGHGVGCGIVTEGHRYHNSSGLAPEIGHMSIDVHGNRCACGNVGCLETYIRSPVILEKVKRATGRAMTYREICEAEGDPAIDAIMEEMIVNLSDAVVSALNILNCEIVLLCLDSIYWPERWVAMLEDIINARKFAGRETRTPVRKAGFMEKTQVLGAVCNAVNNCFKGELRLIEAE